MMLTQNERLYLTRRRLSLTQTEFAVRYHVASDTYRRYESGRILVPKSWQVPEIDKLTDIERYVILRRRNYGNRVKLVAAMRATARPDLTGHLQKRLRLITVDYVLSEEMGHRLPRVLPAWWSMHDLL
jgi:transcriptional regulator with XRE-family HTH domain